MADSLADANFELLLSLNSVSDTAAELLETRWVNEQEVALKSLSVDFDGTLDIDLDNGDLSIRLDAFELLDAGSIPVAIGKLTVLNELLLPNLAGKFFL